MKYQVNDIIYTKNGKVSGNLTIVDIRQLDLTHSTITIYICMSDYGNMVERTFLGAGFSKYFYVRPGKAGPGHKYYNYKESNPELFI